MHQHQLSRLTAKCSATVAYGLYATSLFVKNVSPERVGLSRAHQDQAVGLHVQNIRGLLPHLPAGLTNTRNTRWESGLMSRTAVFRSILDD